MNEFLSFENAWNFRTRKWYQSISDVKVLNFYRVDFSGSLSPNEIVVSLNINRLEE